MSAMQSIVGRLLLILLVELPVPAALGDGTLTIHVANDTVDNLVVTLYDRNLSQNQTVLSGQTINSNAWIVTQISADASGQGHVYWTAMTTDRHMRQCGHHAQSGINGGDTIHVHADGPCSH
ncbi:MAG TPA: hypothetical protein VFE08_07710 [Candidatus Sulfotelmatobacter sp.]|nr:hypothetical protein [Candidatus Sulfotelmatobacter sp.]